MARTATGQAAPPDSALASAALEDLFSETMVFLHGAARRQGLTLLQLVALRVVAHTGSLSPSDLAEKLGVSRPAVTSSINILEAGGWVLRSHPRGDRRRLRHDADPPGPASATEDRLGAAPLPRGRALGDRAGRA